MKSLDSNTFSGLYIVSRLAQSKTAIKLRVWGSWESNFLIADTPLVICSQKLGAADDVGR
jgi:hypothetical protein